MNLDNLYSDSVAKLGDILANDLECAKQQVKQAKRRHKESLKMVQVRVDEVRKLITSGILEDTENVVKMCTSYNRWSEYNQIDVTSKLHILRTLYGSEFIELSDEKSLVEGTDDKLKVFIKRRDKYVGPRMYVVVKLDATAKCRVVENVSRYKSLVCDLD